MDRLTTAVLWTWKIKNKTIIFSFYAKGYKKTCDLIYYFFQSLPEIENIQNYTMN